MTWALRLREMRVMWEGEGMTKVERDEREGKDYVESDSVMLS